MFLKFTCSDRVRSLVYCVTLDMGNSVRHNCAV